jgi:hypothetical protein
MIENKINIMIMKNKLISLLLQYLLKTKHVKKLPHNRVASPEGNSLVEFYYLSASAIWPYKRGGLWWEWPHKRGTMYTVHIYTL